MYVKVTDENGNPINNGNPFPVSITNSSANLATEAKQEEMIEAIESLAGGDSSSEIFADEETITDTAAALPDVPCAEVWLQSDSANTEDIFIGNDTAQNYKLKPGESISLRITNVNIVYAKTAQNAATLHYIARGPGGIPGGGSQPVPVEVTGSSALKGALATVTTAGTRVQLPSYACREVTIIARRANLGRIYVGGNDVSSSVYGADLGPGDAITLTVNNTNLIYIDASVSGEGVSYVAV